MFEKEETEEKGTEREERREEKDWFLLHDSKHVVKTDSGNMRVVRSFCGRMIERPMHIGFITMETKTLFIPQYLDSSLIIFIRRDELAERRLETGDVYGVPAGSAFYLVNTEEGQRLHVICSIDQSESLGLGAFQFFFIGGGTYLASVLSGFEPETLSSAFNTPTPKRLMEFQQEPMEVEEETTWRKLLNYVFGQKNEKKRNKYGSTIALDGSDYEPLKHSGIGVYHVNLTAGSMMAPHVNPTVTEYGIVLGGSGIIQIVHPNGTQAMKTKVVEGDVFWVPRYFPFCQIASKTDPFEFYGFTTSARKNRPQFLAGASSVLRTLKGPELAAAYSMSNESLNHLIEAQHEFVILPSAAATPQDMAEKKVTSERVKKAIRSYDNDMIMGFD
ncbi:hypothetical protein P3X46_010373 [Hevea brasiliensis]|uniref:Cupin type-1 domain-containing protein n=1 Tax=Hevea brasiliensis TaxID=3981 RepID=A0ABQ9MHQ0_HEVBR|nr:hypothetical protein P3X46_010373 [Hevea brasiliensis]